MTVVSGAATTVKSRLIIESEPRNVLNRLVMVGDVPRPPFGVQSQKTRISFLQPESQMILFTLL
jgi:hypothetical protein